MVTLRKNGRKKVGKQEIGMAERWNFKNNFLWNVKDDAIWEEYSVSGAWKKEIRGREKQNKSMLIKDFWLNVEEFYKHTWGQKVLGKQVIPLVNELLSVWAIEHFDKCPNTTTEKENEEKNVIKKCPVKVLNNDKETVRGFKQASYPAALDQCCNLKLNRRCRDSLFLWPLLLLSSVSCLIQFIFLYLTDNRKIFFDLTEKKIGLSLTGMFYNLWILFNPQSYLFLHRAWLLHWRT